MKKKIKRLNEEKHRQKMSEAKDPAIKLFGKTIPLSDIPANGSVESTGAPSSSTGPVVVENMDQDHADHACSTNSSPEANTNGDGEEREADKVFCILTATHALFWSFC